LIRISPLFLLPSARPPLLSLPLLLLRTLQKPRGDFAKAYNSDAESSASEECRDGEDFDDHTSDASSTYGEILRDLYFNCAAVACWNLASSRSPFDIIVN